MINFNKNKLINKVLSNYYKTFAITLDTVDFVPEKYNKKIYKYIFKNLKKMFKKIDKEDRTFQKELKRKNRKPRKHFLFFKKKKEMQSNA